MKSKRHLKIMELVKEEEIQTQEQLATRLQQEGFDITQATVSRDIKQLGLIKRPLGEGGYKYSLSPNQREKVNISSRIRRMFQDSVEKIDYSDNLVVVKTLPGTAQGVAALLDNSEWENVIGTIAGDDTILMIVKPKDAVKDVIEKLKSLTG
ncbi:arginine repressor [Natroniella sulfidigena]|uniref:arginine repressor n=1 Tax=Natroniella sulfidigena TaxID=723921 RepID=UPI00200B4D1C|nr:arginine repressor [Natroniella sulfidigena]MCK8817528.1 arginine repressor [Natroniella sulfidigena]